jgi:anti-anti-sigma factor
MDTDSRDPRSGNPRKTILPVRFRFPGSLVPRARSVSVLDPFNGWTPSSHRLTKTLEGDWVITIRLSPGRVVYYFDVDGTTWLDPQDDGRIPNGWGSEYSVRNVAPISEPPSSLRSLSDQVPIGGGAQVFEWRAEETPEATTLRPSGEMDLGTVSIFRDALTAATVRGRSKVVDMRGIEYMDSCGIHALLEHAESCKQHGGLLVLVAPNAPVQKIIEITGLDDAMPVLASVEVALDLLRARLSSALVIQTNAGNG